MTTKKNTGLKFLAHTQANAYDTKQFNYKRYTHTHKYIITHATFLAALRQLVVLSFSRPYVIFLNQSFFSSFLFLAHLVLFSYLYSYSHEKEKGKRDKIYNLVRNWLLKKRNTRKFLLYLRRIQTSKRSQINTIKFTSWYFLKEPAISGVHWKTKCFVYLTNKGF